MASRLGTCRGLLCYLRIVRDGLLVSALRKICTSHVPRATTFFTCNKIPTLPQTKLHRASSSWIVHQLDCPCSSQQALSLSARTFVKYISSAYSSRLDSLVCESESTHRLRPVLKKIAFQNVNALNDTTLGEFKKVVVKAEPKQVEKREANSAPLRDANMTMELMNMWMNQHFSALTGPPPSTVTSANVISNSTASSTTTSADNTTRNTYRSESLAMQPQHPLTVEMIIKYGLCYTQYKRSALHDRAARPEEKGTGALILVNNIELGRKARQGNAGAASHRIIVLTSRRLRYRTEYLLPGIGCLELGRIAITMTQSSRLVPRRYGASFQNKVPITFRIHAYVVSATGASVQ
ncbi:unnamed protein product, partial [Trichogramma brassicae]